MSAWESEASLAAEAARKAGAHLRDAFTRGTDVHSDAGRDIKTAADQEAEAIILQALTDGSAYPILAEESGSHGDVNPDTPVWVVDPLDGTMNFTRGLPGSCVSIALCQGESPLLGVVHDFHRDDTYVGVVGSGATLNGARIRVSERTDVKQGILATGFPTHFAFDDAACQRLFGEYQRFKKIRMFGSAALSLAYVASGRVEAYAEDAIMLWDVAAGLALVMAAGGHVSTAPAGAEPWSRIVRAANNTSVWEA